MKARRRSTVSRIVGRLSSSFDAAAPRSGVRAEVGKVGSATRVRAREHARAGQFDEFWLCHLMAPAEKAARQLSQTWGCRTGISETARVCALLSQPL
jgi:hypothetical protein